jgi:peptidoglycan/LPS O-acetylase OafA/YrhL
MSWLGIGVSFLTGLVFLPSPMPGATGWKLFPLNDPSWSLFFELIANLALAVYWRRLSNRNLAMVCLVAGGVLAMSVLNLGYAAEGFRWPGMLMGLLRVFYSFFAGVLIYRFRDRIRLGVHPLIALLLVAAALLGAPPDRWRAIYDLAWMLVGFPAVIALASAREPAVAGAGAFRFLGVTSYGVYVLHYPLQRLIMIAATAMRIDISAFAPWGGLIFVAAVTALCWRLDSVYDQPMRRRLTERLRDSLAPAAAPALTSASRL